METNSNTQMLQSLVMQTAEDVMELTKTVSEVSTLLKESIKMSQMENTKTVERLVRHRQELNELKTQIEDLKRSRKIMVRALTIIGSALGVIVTTAAVDLMETVFFK